MRGRTLAVPVVAVGVAMMVLIVTVVVGVVAAAVAKLESGPDQNR